MFDIASLFTSSPLEDNSPAAVAGLLNMPEEVVSFLMEKSETLKAKVPKTPADFLGFATTMQTFGENVSNAVQKIAEVDDIKDVMEILGKIKDLDFTKQVWSEIKDLDVTKLLPKGGADE